MADKSRNFLKWAQVKMQRQTQMFEACDENIIIQHFEKGEDNNKTKSVRFTVYKLILHDLF